MKKFPESELIINADGSIFHLHLHPGQLADKILLVGDPDRVTMVASYFDTIECDISSREFHTITGTYKGKRISAISHGIGTDNIDIVMNELDALANINLVTRTQHPTFKQLTLIRVGTSGGLQPFLNVGSFCIAEKSIGLDSVLSYYKGRDNISERDYEEAYMTQIGWNPRWGVPYVVSADPELVSRFDGMENITKGITISAVGFYGPQGRELRLELADPNINSKIEQFSYQSRCITNYEMESSALAALAKLMGHKAMTICSIIANRLAKEANANYKTSISDLIELVLEKI